ncbi:hypothetical protein ACIBO9_28320 [Streptomyces prunicolor]|uniref:hypothetical protein n=1 Tax=Streptomyces prunicolor TaxID=67348 RepID=UPI0037D0657D
MVLSRSLRRAAADEQLRDWPIGTADRAQEAARRHLHAALFGTLTEVGYLVEADPPGTPGALSVRASRISTPTTLAADIGRILADLHGIEDSSEHSGLSP